MNHLKATLISFAVLAFLTTLVIVIDKGINYWVFMSMALGFISLNTGLQRKS